MVQVVHGPGVGIIAADSEHGHGSGPPPAHYEACELRLTPAVNRAVAADVDVVVAGRQRPHGLPLVSPGTTEDPLPRRQARVPNLLELDAVDVDHDSPVFPGTAARPARNPGSEAHPRLDPRGSSSRCHPPRFIPAGQVLDGDGALLPSPPAPLATLLRSEQRPTQRWHRRSWSASNPT